MAPDYPDTKFAIIDMVVDQPNVQSVVFTEEQGSYLVGMLAAMASKTGTVGFIGGMDIPLIRKFACGYAQGVKAVNPDAKVIAEHDRHHAGGLERPGEGRRTDQGADRQGADVIYAAAGGTGVGVLQTAADEGILSIGVDSNQNYLHPGKVLTSMMKRVDNAVYDAFKARRGPRDRASTSWASPTAASTMRWTTTTPALVTDEMKAAVDEAKAKIIDGRSRCTTTCPTIPARRCKAIRAWADQGLTIRGAAAEAAGPGHRAARHLQGLRRRCRPTRTSRSA